MHQQNSMNPCVVHGMCAVQIDDAAYAEMAAAESAGKRKRLTMEDAEALQQQQQQQQQQEASK
jgi:hypothetical protein